MQFGRDGKMTGAPKLVGQQMVLPKLSRFQAGQPHLRLEISTTVARGEFLQRDAGIALRFIRPESGRYTVRHVGRQGDGLYGCRS
jgi:DNA-binding transcriptional LysR family regulator